MTLDLVSTLSKISLLKRPDKPIQKIKIDHKIDKISMNQEH